MADTPIPIPTTAGANDKTANVSGIAASAQDKPASPQDKSAGKSFVSNAKVIGMLTFVSRILGLARESIAASYFGAGGWSPFTVAFTIPNLFRKLLGEGALSAAFIPLYAQSVKEDPIEKARAFANASVNLLMLLLIGITIVGEAVILCIGLLGHLQADDMVALKFTAIMLPYVMLVCGAAFMGSILQVHKRFAAISAVPILLNLSLIAAILIAAHFLDLSTPAGRYTGGIWLSISVLVAGILQIMALAPSLRAVGFKFHPVLHFWTPGITLMLRKSLPVAISAGVLQLSVMIDRGLSYILAGPAGSYFTFMGLKIPCVLDMGAAARLNWSQYLYQFPLGVFGIALATAIFPALSDDALDESRKRFRNILRSGIEASLFIGLPASIGLIVVRYPAIRLMFERGEFTSFDTFWVAKSTIFYAAAIWAFSLQQILNRAYYALHDMTTPLVLSIVTIVVNLLVELPLMWSPLKEAGMAMGTCVSFSVQALVMIYMLNRRVGGLDLHKSLIPIGKMLIASVVMGLTCWGVSRLPIFPAGTHRMGQLVQLSSLMAAGGASYVLACVALRLPVVKHVIPKRFQKAKPTA